MSPNSCPARLVCVMTFLVTATPASAAGAQPASSVDIDVRVYATPAISQASRAQMRDTAERILEAAGIATRWHDCAIPTPEPTCAPPPGRKVVIVRFVDDFRQGTCGDARTNSLSGGLVSISGVCVSAVGHAIRSIPDAPLLLRVRDGDIFGVVLAHEIGHVLGQSHTSAGIMRRLYTRVEWEQLAIGRLAFSTRQAQALRAAVTPILERDAVRP
jgi:hypothetical protein